MCVACGNVGSTAVTASAVTTTALAFSPILGVFFYTLRNIIGIQARVKKGMNMWLIGGLISLYNTAIYAAFAVFTRYFKLYQSTEIFAVIAVLGVCVYTGYIAFTLRKNARALHIGNIMRLSLIQLLPFTLLYIIAQLAANASYLINIYVHGYFGLHYSFLAGVMAASIMFIALMLSEMWYKENISVK